MSKLHKKHLLELVERMKELVEGRCGRVEVKVGCLQNASHNFQFQYYVALAYFLTLRTIGTMSIARAADGLHQGTTFKGRHGS